MERSLMLLIVSILIVWLYRSEKSQWSKDAEIVNLKSQIRVLKKIKGYPQKTDSVSSLLIRRNKLEAI